MRLVDNKIYGEGNDNICFTPNKKGKEESLLTSLSAKTIKELNENTSEGILVYPHSFAQCKDKLEDLKILDYNTSILQTYNLIGFVGNGTAQIEINSRFSKLEKTTNNENVQDYFLYYMLSKVFAVNIVNMEVGGGSLKEIDLLIFIFPRLLKEALRQGLFKQYVKREYNDANVKGTINISKHIRFNYPANGRIAYSTKEFSYDNKIT